MESDASPGWMSTDRPPRPETDLRTHIHFNLMAKSQFIAPTIFTKEVTEAFHKVTQTYPVA